MSRVFITSELPGESVARLSKTHEVTVFSEDRPPTEAELLENSRDADALVTMVSDRVTGELMNSSPNLKIVANCAVGFENIDVDAATVRGIYVTNTPGVLTETTADLVWALMLSVARRTSEGDRFTRKGLFEGWKPSLLLGVNIHNKTLGIFGMGRIGTAAAKRARGFGMEILYHNRNRNIKAEEEIGAGFVEFDELLTRSDFIVITAPLNEGTLGRFGSAEFKKMKPSSVLINTGRGPIIKEKELALALKNGDIWGAGLDVYEREPKIHDELLSLDNIVLLPHLGSATTETRENMVDMAIRNVESALAGKTPANLVNMARRE